jgi:hypothetical protein
VTRTHVFMVMPRFVDLIERHIKLTTIRADRKRMPKAGEYIDLRRWKGKPYRSKQERVLLCMISTVRKIEIRRGGVILVDGKKLTSDEAELLARRDGFPDQFFLFAFFDRTHGLTFKGFITEWL